ncbi:TldD/PmbA family protein [Romeria aff. gracilis LEGE 07310]|uniref:TldD/PmbA family protein n=1 Tax=Vasconcelosia minhoensis LEGE 07310 TaxID=915328 RepID=A0A8J7AFY0_9CYAN|nr:TldD/PmbA family protein [Romeria gracilis]MBE9076768.1 TldD/PmbA family protein [Romeria aff. gracilis LEGE 07310]
MANIQTMAEQAEKISRQLGIDKYDIYGSSVEETSVQVDRGEPKQVKASQRSSVIVRVWNGDRQIGVTSTTDIDPTGLELALKTAYEASSFGAREHVPDFSPEAQAPTAEVTRSQISPAPVPDLVEKLVYAEKELLEAHPAIASVPYNGLAQRALERFYLNSDGALRSEARTYASIYLYSKTEQEGRKPRSAGAVRVESGLKKLDIAGCLQEAAEKTVSHLDYERIPSGKYQVVFSADAFLSLLSAFSNLFNAQSILDNRSLSTPDSLGQQIASPLLSLYDDELNANNIAAETFDGEGTPTRRLPLIENGVLTHFIHSAGTARRMGATPTGHASIGAKVSVSPNYFHVMPGEAADDSYRLDRADNVILIDELQALHAGVNALQGSFSLPFDGWLLRDGKRISVESATVAGDFRQVLNSILHIEPDAEVIPGGICPRIWVSELSITGEE